MKISKERGPKRPNPYQPPTLSQDVGVIGSGRFAKGDGGGTYFYAVYPAGTPDHQIKLDFLSKARSYCQSNGIRFDQEYWSAVANALHIGDLPMGSWQTETEI